MTQPRNVLSGHAELLVRSGEISGRRAALAMLLVEGGDQRIALDPQTRRNRYGMAATPQPQEITFASTTANTISEPGFQIAEQALDRLLSSDRAVSVPIDQWFDDIRASLTSYLGQPHAQAILASSGTDGEIIALSLAAGLAQGPLTTIVIAPEETGSGVPMAASGRHFASHTALGTLVAMGCAIDGFAHDIEIAAVPIRDADGAPRSASAVDDHAAELAARALKSGRTVLLHVLDTSKTGLAGLSRASARAIKASDPARVHVVVDACQLRCRFTTIKRDLDDGFIVLATGSKFAGGPSFCGAVLLPPALAEDIAAGTTTLASGLADYSAAFDWPLALRHRLGLSWRNETNIGLGLRWSAAFHGLAVMEAMDDIAQMRIAERFAKEVGERATSLLGLENCGRDHDPTLGSSTIVSLVVKEKSGFSSTLQVAQAIQAALRKEEHGPICHIGQPVCLGARTVLRVAASAYTLWGGAERMRQGCDLDRAFRPVAAELDRLFEKWCRVDRQL